MERATKSQSRRSRFIRLGFSAGVGVVIWYMPVPEGVRAEAWHLLAIFVATIVAIILEPLPMGAVAVAVDAPPLLAALVLGFFSNLFSSMTHYSTGPAPVLFGSGYVKLADWWKLGALISVVNVTIWLGIGGFWWKIIGLW